MILLLSYRDLTDVRAARFADYAMALAVTRTRAYLDDPSLTALVVDTDASQFDLGSKLMVDLYNALREEGDGSVSKFENRTIARSRFVARLESRFGNLPITTPTSEASEVADENPQSEASTEGEDITMTATATKEKKIRAKTANGSKPRNSYKDGAKIDLIVKENPKREKSEAYKRYALYRDGMLVTTFLEKGGTGADLKHDLEKKHIKIVNP